MHRFEAAPPLLDRDRPDSLPLAPEPIPLPAPVTPSRFRLGALIRRVPAPVQCLAYMAVLFGLAVGIDRAISFRLFAHPTAFVPAYRSFQDYDVSVKLQQFRGLEGRHFDAFFIGNSRTMFGVNPAVFDATLRRAGERFHSYNLAEESVNSAFWQPFFSRYYGRRPPHYLLLGVLPRDFDASYTAQANTFRNAFFSSAGFANRNMSAVNRDAEDQLSKLFILHGRVSDLRLISLSDILHGRRLDLHQGRLANSQGWMELPQSVLSTPKSFLARQAAALAHRHGDQAFKLGGEEQRSVTRLNSWVRGGGGCLILFTTPLLYDREPWGTVEMRRGFTQAMRRLTTTVPGLQFIDIGARVQGRYTPQDFGDGDHLDGQGATLFSTQLAQALAPAMASSACARR